MPRSVSGNTLSTMAAKVKPPPGPPPTKPPGPPPVKPGGIKSLIKLFSSSSAASPPPARSVSVSAFPSPIQGPARKSLPESARNRTGSDGGSGGDEPTPFNYANPLMMARKTRSGGSPSVSLVYGELSESTPGAGLSEGSVSSSMAMSGSKQQDMFGLNSGTQNECQIFPGICVWRTPASNGRAADDNEATTVDRVTPYRAAITLINSSESNGHLPVWGLVPSGWHWSMPGIPKFSPEELELLSPRRALALSVFFETARRLDLDTNRESWLQTLLRQSQVWCGVGILSTYCNTVHYCAGHN